MKCLSEKPTQGTTVCVTLHLIIHQQYEAPRPLLESNTFYPLHFKFYLSHALKVLKELKLSPVQI